MKALFSRGLCGFAVAARRLERCWRWSGDEAPQTSAGQRPALPARPAAAEHDRRVTKVPRYCYDQNLPTIAPQLDAIAVDRQTSRVSVPKEHRYFELRA